ncbi:ABC transporter permease [bacterium]|nr:ABC transporter permease [bacterium]MBU1985095.1 ABC transporter permease [bacterium]
MRARLVRTIFHKELRDVLRDRRTLFIMVFLPIILYPLLLVGIIQITVLQLARMEKKEIRVVVLGRDHVPHLGAVLDTLKGVAVVDTANWQLRIREGDLEAALDFPVGFEETIQAGRGSQVSMYFNGSRELSELARNRVERVLESWKDGIVAARLSDLTADTSLLRPFTIQSENLATAEQRQGDWLGRILGYMLILMTMMGAFYPAVDLTAGEKERGTLETLLVSPASRGEIVYGKFLAVALIAILTAVLNLVSMGVTAAFGLSQLGSAAAEAMPRFAISPVSLTLSLLLILPMAVLFAAVCMAIATGARNYKEGQSLLTPVYTLVILPAMVSLIPGMEITPVLAAVPIVNVSLLIKEFMMGNYLWLEMLIALGTTSILAAVALWWATDQFRQESVLFRHAEDVKWSPFRRRAGLPRTPQPTPATALLIVAVEVLALFYLGGLTQKWGVTGSILVNQAIVLLIPLAVLQRGGYNIRRALAMNLPRPAAWLATVVAMFGAWLFTIQLSALMNVVLPFPSELIERFEKFFTELNQLAPVAGLLLLAGLPGICEEILARGLVLRSLLPRFGTAGAIVISALAFGALHLDLYRLLPTVVLGGVLGIIAVWSGSIFPAMLAHAMNNGLAYLVQRYPDVFMNLPWLAPDSQNYLPWHIFLIAVLLLAGGLYWLKKTGGAGAASGSEKS